MIKQAQWTTREDPCLSKESTRIKMRVQSIKCEMDECSHLLGLHRLLSNKVNQNKVTNLASMTTQCHKTRQILKISTFFTLKWILRSLNSLRLNLKTSVTPRISGTEPIHCCITKLLWKTLMPRSRYEFRPSSKSVRHVKNIKESQDNLRSTTRTWDKFRGKTSAPRLLSKLNKPMPTPTKDEICSKNYYNLFIIKQTSQRVLWFRV